MKGRRAAKEEATATARRLLESAVAHAAENLESSRAGAELARKVRLRFNIRLGDDLKRYTCRGCKGLIVPGVNARVRLGHGDPPAIRITCTECGRVNRKILGRPYIRSGKVGKSDS